MLLREEINIPIAQLVSIWLEYVSLSDELAGELAAIHSPEFDRVMTGQSGAPDMAAVAGFTLTPHLTDRRTLAELMDACEPLSRPRLPASVVCGWTGHGSQWRMSATNGRADELKRIKQLEADLVHLERAAKLLMSFQLKMSDQNIVAAAQKSHAAADAAVKAAMN